MISRALMAILRCPLHPNSGPLKISAVDTPASRPNGSLNCQRCGHVYPITDGIPDMFVANVDHESFLKAESAQWDRFSSTYDEIRISDPIYMACVEAAVEQLRPQPHDVVLDAACGTGLTIKQYYAARPRVIAFDLSVRSLHHLRQHMQDHDIAIDYVRGDLNALPFRKESFDKVLCANAVSQLPTEALRQHCIGEIARVARPAARIVVTTHNFSKPKRHAGWPKERKRPGNRRGKPQYIYRLESHEFRDLLATSLVVDRVGGAGLPLPYRNPFGALSTGLERFLRRFPTSADWGHMLVGVCHNGKN